MPTTAAVAAVVGASAAAASAAYSIYSQENAPKPPQSGACNVTYSGGFGGGGGSGGGFQETPQEKAFYQLQSLAAQKAAEQQTNADIIQAQAAQTQSTDYHYILMALLVAGLYAVLKKRKFL
jgi:hypothetical protein